MSLAALAESMRKGVTVKDRRYRLRTYKSCFLGSEAVAWLVAAGHADDKSGALREGNRMLRAGMFYHVTREHLFEDARLFYRFAVDDCVNAGGGKAGSSLKFEGANYGVDRAKKGDDGEDNDCYGVVCAQWTSESESVPARAPLTSTARIASAADDDIVSDQKSTTTGQRTPVAQIACALAASGEEYLNIRNILTQFCNRSLTASEKNSMKTGIRLAKQEPTQQLSTAVTQKIQDLIADSHFQRERSASARKISLVLFAILASTICLRLSFWVASSLLVLLSWLLRKDLTCTFICTTDRGTGSSPHQWHGMKTVRSATAGSTPAMLYPGALPNSSGATKRLSVSSLDTKGAAPALPEVTVWPLRPVLLHMASDGLKTLTRPPPPLANTFRTFPINSAHFEGRMLVLLRNAPCAEQSRLDAYFEGHRRVSVNYVQGRFKRRLPMDQVMTGQTFRRPLVNMPSQMLIKVAFGFLRGLAPNLHADVTSVRPYILTPLISAAQSVHVALSKDEAPDLMRAARRELSDEDMEDARPHLGDESDNNIMNNRARMSAANRRKTFKNARVLRDKYFEPTYTYTFGFWQDLFDPVDYGVHLPFGTFDVSAYLDGQALQIQAQVGTETVPDTDLLWRVDLWNEKLLPGLAKAEAEGR